MFSNLAQSAEERLITHETTSTLNILSRQKRIQSIENPIFPHEEEMHLLNQLTEFELGRFLLANKGLNGYWTAYIIVHAPQKQLDHPLENWLIHHMPVIKATRERFGIFKHQLQKYLKNDTTMASVPCGLMDDLLGLDYSHVKNVNLVGIDLDEKSLTSAKENSEKHNKTKMTSFIKKGAWHLDAQEKFDVITSNGLNIYEPDDAKVLALYQEFFKALKPGGILITSFLTPPPALSRESSWKNYNIEDALKQKAILNDIIQIRWQTFRTESLTRVQLEEAGFKILDIIYDSQGMFPTVVAQK